MKSYQQLLAFINKEYKKFIFVAVFYSLWLVYKYALTFDPQLASFPGRMIGEATLNAYDINKRINIFYYSGFLFFLSIALFSFIAWRISLLRENFLNTVEARIINYSSLAGITFYFFNLWTKSFDSSLELIYCIHIAALAGMTLKLLLLKNKPQAKLIDTSFYAIIFVLSVSVFFVLNEIAVLFNVFSRLDFITTILISVIIALCAASMYLRTKEPAEARSALNRLAFLVIPIACIPVLSFFKDEIYLILNRHQVYYFSPRKLYLFFLLCIALITFYRYKRFQKGKTRDIKRNDQLVALRYLPLLVISLATYTFYSPYTDISNEMFEAGNRFLPVMEFSKFGVVPIFEKFNSHVLSELFFGSIYAFFNGLHSREMYIYEFVYQVFWAFMVYIFIYRLSRSAYIALFVILLFPLIDTVLFDYTIIAIPVIFILDKVIREPASFKNYLLLMGVFAFLVLWRIDIGYPTIISGSVILVVYKLNREQFKISWKLVFKALAVLIGIVLSGLLIIGWCREINVFEKLWSGLNYLASAQTYGLTSFGDAAKSQYKIQYFVFPLIMILIAGAMLVFYKRFNISRAQRFIYTAFLFIIAYYFVNFQRGLVRHSFVEGHDNGVSSFAFFIFSAGVFLFCQKRSKVFRLIAFMVVSVVLMMNYKFPSVTEFKSLYSKAADKANVFPVIEPKPDIVRCIDNSNFEEEQYGNFKKFIAERLSEDQTFIDFSNLPMLYYFTGKITPSYFYQNPLSIHNDYLQNSFVADMKEYDAPFLVFSNFTKNWWNAVDGVPNTLRHYRMAEYFYSNYKPFAIIDKLCLWKRNDFQIKNEQQPVYNYSIADSSQKDLAVLKKTLKAQTDKNYLLKAVIAKDAPEIKVSEGKTETMLKAAFVNDMEHTAYYIFKPTGTEFTFELPNGTKNVSMLSITAYDFIPDFYSDYPQAENILNLPYIWANYDRTVHQEVNLVSLVQAPQKLQKDNISYFNFSSAVDKSSGNMLLISLSADNNEPIPIDLMYGSSKHGYKGAYKFLIPAGAGAREFAVRLSAQYNWYFPEVDYVALTSNSDKEIIVNSMQLLKGD